ncbi:MAG TPA: hypothetical protein EYP86_04785 [Candidatus Altiarchaeales archaeon]|nr:hypothetical protein [Candidatus Altiarchaeales archaeon]
MDIKGDMSDRRREAIVKGILLGTEFALFIILSIMAFLFIGRKFGDIGAAIGGFMGAIFGLIVGVHRMIKFVNSISKGQGIKDERK